MQSGHEEDRQEAALELNFVPSWARKPSGFNPYLGDDVERQRQSPSRTGPKRGRRAAGRSSPRPDRRDRPDARRRAAAVQDGRRDAAPPRRPPDLPLKISFVPERKSLGALVRRIRSTGRAYPLMDLAGIFLDHPQACLVKIEQSQGPPAPATCLLQCIPCKAVFLNTHEMDAHGLAAHIGDFFDRREVESEPPAGQFSCVGRCRLSGVLVGPPNYHGFNEQVQALHRERYSTMPLDVYRNQIEMLHDPEKIEEWKKNAAQRVLYRRKDSGVEEFTLTRAEAEILFTKEIAPGLSRKVTRALLPANTARALPPGPLRDLMRNAWNRENRHPASLLMALRPALRHMRLHLFKTSGHTTFVTAFKPHPVAPDRTVTGIAEILEHLAAHPGCKPAKLVADIHPEAQTDTRQARAVLAPLRWLVERGHVVEFFDGSLAVPRR